MSEKQPQDEILELIRWVDKQECKLFKRSDAFHGSALLLIAIGVWLFVIVILLLFGSISVVDKTIIGLTFAGVVLAVFTLLAQFGRESIVEANFDKALKLRQFNPNERILLKALIKIKAKNSEFELEELYDKDKAIFTKEKLLERLCE